MLRPCGRARSGRPSALRQLPEAGDKHVAAVVEPPSPFLAARSGHPNLAATDGVPPHVLAWLRERRILPHLPGPATVMP